MFCQKNKKVPARDAKDLLEYVHCERDGHKTHKLAQWRLTVDSVNPPGNVCSRMRSKLPLFGHQGEVRLNLVIFKMAGNFPDRPCTDIHTHARSCAHILTYRRIRYIKKFYISD